MKTTYLGHSCFEIETNDIKLLFDPFISPNQLAKSIDINTIVPDYILITHGHFDHIADLENIQKKSNAKVICIAEIAQWLGQKDITNVHGMNIGGGFDFEFGRVKMVYALHSSSMPNGQYGGNPAGFLLHLEGKKIYFAGDTALTTDMKLLGDENVDWAFLPVGDNYTMGAEDALKASDFINCKKIIGMHFDTFPEIKIDKEKVRTVFSLGGIAIKLPEIKETFDLD